MKLRKPLFRKKKSERSKPIRPNRLSIEALEPRLVLNGLSLVINEFMAANAQVHFDEDDDSSDWLEIYNPTDAAVDLDGWYLTDDREDLAKWEFPDVTLAQDEYLVVFASQKDRHVAGSELHTNFKLTQDGEYLALVDSDAVTVVHEYAPGYPKQFDETSYGLSRDLADFAVLGGENLTYLVPQDDSLGTQWRDPEFDDSGWSVFAEASSVLITEAGTGSPDYWEIQNVSEVEIDTTDWIVVANNAQNYEINDVHSPLWSFPASMSPGELIYRPDVTGDNIFWRSADDGWVVILDDDGKVVDFVIWGYPEKQVADINLNVNGFTNITLTDAWTGPHVDGSQALTSTVQRTGSSDHDSASDWTFDAPGTANSQNEGLTVPLVLDTTTGIGFDSTGTGVGNAVLADIEGEMLGTNASAYLRYPFGVSDPTSMDSLKLHVKYNDGFVAYLNGQEVARRNAPETLQWDSAATAGRDAADSLAYETIDLSAWTSVLRTGANLLAVQGLNVGAADGDFLFLVDFSGTGFRYFTEPTPGEPNAIEGFSGYVRDTHFSVDRGFFTEPFNVVISTNTPNATIYYTTDGSKPGPAGGSVYTDPITVIRTTTLLAVAVKDGLLPTDVDAQTYLFLEDIKTQTRPPGYPTATEEPPYQLDYAIDPRVVNDPLYADEFIDDLLAIPTVSIVMDKDDLFSIGSGIYANAIKSGVGWEKGTSVEYFDPNSTDEFQINSAIRIQGAYSRWPQESPKHAFRLNFKPPYGPPKLDYKMFDDSPADEFDQLILRMSTHDSWHVHQDAWRTDATYAADQWHRETQLAMGHLSAHSKHVHLYLNGMYWGLYEIEERPNAPFAAAYLGGDEGDYDAINGGLLRDGTITAWNTMNSIANSQGQYGSIANEAAYEELKQYLDVDSFVDYLITNIYSGNMDWPGKNYYAVRKREPGEGFRFISWDSEASFWKTWGGSPAAASAAVWNGLDYPFFNTSNHGAGFLYNRLNDNAEFRMLLADRLHKHLENDGILTPTLAADMYQAQLDKIYEALVPESARWGDAWRASLPYTRDAELAANTTWLFNNFFPVRSQNVLGYFRADGMYPNLDPPAFNQHGGEVPEAFQLDISASTGTIYYTLDGSDPRLSGGNTSPDALVYSEAIALQEDTLVKSRTLSGSVWSALNEAAFIISRPSLAGKLVVSELNYHPHDPTSEEYDAGWIDDDDFEFLELLNTSNESLDLTGAQFTTGITFTFPPTLGTEASVVVTEAGTGSPDYIEIQNVSDASVDTTGWVAGANNAFNFNINDVHSTLWSLPTSLVPGQLWDRADTTEDNVFWRTAEQGWVMIVDGSGSLVDFVVWGYGPNDLAGMNVTVGGFSGNPTLSGWSGAAVDPSSANSNALQRQGNADQDNASDWSFDVAASATYQNPGMFVPFMATEDRLSPGEYVVIASNAAAFRARYGQNVPLVGEYTGSLSNGGEQIVLTDAAGRTVLDFTYGDSGNSGWPNRADGNGATLELLDPTETPIDFNLRNAHLADGVQWRSSGEYLGTPGTAGTGSFQGVVVNEVLTHTDYPLVDAIELYNSTDADIPIGGWWLSDDSDDFQKFQIPAGVTIPAYGYATFYEGHYEGQTLQYDAVNEFGGLDVKDFALSGARGDDVWLLADPGAGGTLRFADHVEFGSANNGESFGRWPDETGDLYPMTSRTFDGPNSGPRIGPDVLISEVMYNAPEVPGILPENLEFIEIFNTTSQPINLTGWRLRKGFDFDFAPGTMIGSREALVIVAFDPSDVTKLADFRSYYGIATEVPIVGTFGDRLSNTGEQIQLQRPDAPPADDPLYVPHPLEDQIEYVDTWYAGANGEGQSLNRAGVNLWGNDQASWSPESPTPGEAEQLNTTVVTGRHIFYNNSSLGGAIAPDKTALRPGEQASFANYTSYAKGINGIILDVFGLANPDGIDATDFTFKLGGDDTPGDWTVAPTPASVDATADQIILTWDDGVIRNTWLEVTVLVTLDTGLTVPDMFYFGNAVGETGNSPNDAGVDATDVLLTRQNPHPFFDPAEIDNVYDFNRDRRVDAIDTLIARNNQTWSGTELGLIDLTSKAAVVELGSKNVGQARPLNDATPNDATLDALFAEYTASRSHPSKLAKKVWLDEFDLAWDR